MWGRTGWRRWGLVALLVVGGAVGGGWLLRALFPSEATRLARRVEESGARLLRGEVEAILPWLALDAVELEVEAEGSRRVFVAGDEEGLLAEGREALRWLPPKGLALVVRSCEVDGGRARAVARLGFDAEGRRYVDDFALGFVRVDGAWRLGTVRLVERR